MHKTLITLFLLHNCLVGASGRGIVSDGGDFVYSYDTITGVVEQKEVTAVFVRESDHINYLTIIDEQGREQVIETTDGHPFWVVTDNPDLSRAAREVVDENGVILYHENLEPGLNGFWVEAKNLRAGDVFIGANGELSVLVAVERVTFPDGIKVYNFTVDGNHNYFVIAQTGDYGQTCILVHNAEYSGWIKHDTYNKIRNTLGSRGVDNFVNSMNKGIVRSKGENGIKQLSSGVQIGKTIYQYEIKIKGNMGTYRVFGNFDANLKRIIFDLFEKGIH